MQPWLGPTDPNWHSSRNMLAAIEVGLSEWYTTHLAPQRHAPPRMDNRTCFQDIGTYAPIYIYLCIYLFLLSLFLLLLLFRIWLLWVRIVVWQLC